MITAQHSEKVDRLIDIVTVCAHAVRYLADVPSQDQDGLALHVASLLDSIHDDAWDLSAMVHGALKGGDNA